MASPTSLYQVEIPKAAPAKASPQLFLRKVLPIRYTQGLSLPDFTSNPANLSMKLPYFRAPNPHAQAAANLYRALVAVHLFGHIRHAELARLVWPEATADTRATAASRFFKKLVTQKYLVKRLNSMGTYSYVLGLRGAMYVGRHLKEGSREGTRISGVQGRGFFHRTLGSAWMVEQLLAGKDVHTEFSVNSGRYAITRQALAARWGKLPDGLVVREELDENGKVLHYLVDWLEVESTHKGLKERSRVMDMIWVLGRPLLDNLPFYLDRLILLYTADSGHEAMLVQSAITRWRQDGHQIDDPKALLGSVLLVAADVSAPLSIRGFNEQDLYTLMQRSDLLPELSKPLAENESNAEPDYPDEY